MVFVWNDTLREHLGLYLLGTFFPQMTYLKNHTYKKYSVDDKTEHMFGFMAYTLQNLA